jgi:hypothetical protein
MDRQRFRAVESISVTGQEAVTMMKEVSFAPAWAECGIMDLNT